MSRFIGVIALLFFFSSSARAELLVHWDCNLALLTQRSDPRDPEHDHCRELHSAYFSNLPIVREVNDANQADLAIRVSANAIAGGMQVVFHMTGARELPKFVAIERVSDAFNPDEITVRLTADLERYTAPFLLATRPGEVRSGEVVLTLRDPRNQPGAPPRQDSPSPWYFRPSLSGQISQTSVSMINASAGFEVNFSLPETWRVQGSAQLQYQRVAVPASGTTPEQVSEVFSFGSRTIISRSIRNGWSVAVIGMLAHEPQNNVRISTAGVAGVEWALVPYRRNNENSFGFRYMIGGEYQNYMQPNVHTFDWEAFMIHGLEAYAVLHFRPIDVQFRIGAQSVLAQPEFTSLSSSASLSWRITPSLIVSPSFQISWRNRIISQPSATSDPGVLASFLGANNFGSVVYMGSLTLSYVFGNSLPVSQDMRWSR